MRLLVAAGGCGESNVLTPSNFLPADLLDGNILYRLIKQ
jgi:hypothetical protein